MHRVQQVLDSAAAHGRKVAFVGRSMVRNMGVARDLGLLHMPAGLMVTLDEAAGAAAGEGRADLHRLAGGAAVRPGPDGDREHPQVRIEPGDTVILASSMVPGNETAVYRVINGLAREGAQVVHKEVAMVHVSGHAPAGELLYLLNATKPRNLMPVHGEWRHLRAHAKLAELTGVPADRVVLAEDGAVVDLVGGLASITGKVDCGYVYVDGLAVGDVGEESLKDRRILGDEGFIAITVVVDSVTGKVGGMPIVSGRGFTDDPVAFDPVLPLVTAELERVAAGGRTDPHRLAQSVRRVVGRWVSDTVPPPPDDHPDRHRGLSHPARRAAQSRAAGSGMGGPTTCRP